MPVTKRTVPPGTYVAALSGLLETGAVAHRAEKGLKRGLPDQGAARVTTPTITLANAVDAATPTAVASYLRASTKINPKFTLSGFAYEQASTVFAGYDAVRSSPLPMQAVGFGRAVADFLSDAPLISFKHSRSQAGATRVLVDDVEVLRVGQATRANTAQAGGASTITLDAGASATNGLYVGQYVRITGGTGSGQQAFITGYVGSTKIATVSKAWTTPPDNTSTFEITNVPMTHSNSTQSGFNSYFFKLDWDGERRFRRYRIEHDITTFWGCWTAATDTVLAAPTPAGTLCVVDGDSFAAGTGTDGFYSSLSRILCDHLGWTCADIASGGTGYLNPGTQSLTINDRLFPPTNAWRVWAQDSTAGTYTLTQGGVTTGTINWNDSIATVQAALNAAFGAGAFTAVGQDASRLWLLGRGATASVATAMTISFAGFTGPVTPTCVQYLGNLAPLVPKDGAGNALPFNFVLAAGHNDTTQSNAAYTTAALQAAVSALIAKLYAAYPTINIFVVGVMYLPGGSVPAAATAANTAISAACTASLKKINGTVPFIDPLTAGISTGTGFAGSIQGNGNSDWTTISDGVHPNPFGHYMFGVFIALAILGFLASP